MLGGWFLWFILFWVITMIVLLSIGGFFMFRKFLKRLPKEDGKSELDWQDYYIENSRHLWSNENKQFLDELVTPVPELFRDIARAKIAGKIGELALKENAAAIDQRLIIKGYILATPKRDHTFLKKHLRDKKIDIEPYQALLK
ncbi:MULTISPECIES: DUF2621 domain-containing protein [Bacillus]|uniref:DUF2621 domain-containing protein n=1 Tax=Bacillus halotolerans TaxID=260554 RepID=A0ABY7I5H5_9BACI|nr:MULTISPECIES: DUF2621 domain-containing protein [Bacillus]QQF62446.1 DUF2621 domain-containing protein [Bacillus mojavensis]BDG80155.1 hypothetical protein BSF_18840 [Bacillus subtilis]KUP32777.1 hypothetical protein AU387_10600 [Bacillus halotolerans]KUP37539.1 hypothetical protein AU384_09145 [Bacillus halotolerans]MBJ7570242.1 DUF2621 domain-containing protein [Bacillus halotolerans]